MSRSPQQIADYEASLNRFAELLKQGLTIPVIRTRLGLGKASAHRMMVEIRKQEGERTA